MGVGAEMNPFTQPIALLEGRGEERILDTRWLGHPIYIPKSQPPQVKKKYCSLLSFHVLELNCFHLLKGQGLQ